MPINSIIQSTFFDDKRTTSTQPPLLTITGEFGVGIEEIARDLAAKMGVQCFDYQILDGIIDELDSNQALRKEMKARRSKEHSGWVSSLLQKRGASNTEYVANLVRTIMGIAPMGGVIVGRGAHLILYGQKVLRLKVEAGPEYCAKRVANIEGISLHAARKMANKVNQERMNFVAGIYKKFPVYSSYYDLILSAEILNREQIVDVTLSAIKMAGLRVEEKGVTDNG